MHLQKICPYSVLSKKQAHLPVTHCPTCHRANANTHPYLLFVVSHIPIQSLFDELTLQIQFLRGLPTSFKSSLVAGTTADVAMSSPLPLGRVSDSVSAKSAHIEVVVQRGDWLCEIGRRHNVKLKSVCHRTICVPSVYLLLSTWP